MPGQLGVLLGKERMFVKSVLSVEIQTVVKLKGCPARGLAALDWRRQHGLPERLDDRETIKWSGADEAVYRAAVAMGYSESIDSNGCGVIMAVDKGSGGAFPYVEEVNYRHGGHYGWMASVSAEVVRTCLNEPTSEQMIDLLAEIAEASYERGKKDMPCLRHHECRMHPEMGRACKESKLVAKGE